MLDPGNRMLLADMLRPPDGYRLDRAIGTTYTLDLMTLLTVPVSFTLLDWQSDEQNAGPDPIAMLESIRRVADNIVVFCQAAHIHVPQRQLLFSYLEKSIVEVTPQKTNRAFHPKVWALRFVPDESKNDDFLPVRYRLIVSSRNITFDRSWDTILSLEGHLTDRTNAFSNNHPLGDFIATLPQLTVDDVPDHAQSIVNQLQYEVRRVEFERPDGIEEIKFWPLGLTNRRSWPFQGRVDRMLIMSPFLSAGFLERLPMSEDDILISRPDEIGRLSTPLQERFKARYVLNDLATPVLESDTEVSYQADVSDDSGHGLDEMPNDIHAKVFVADEGWDARVWTGSANATSAAFDGNVEFIVEMRGRKSRLGIDAVLNDGGDSNLLSLLQPIDIVPHERDDPGKLRLEALVDEARRTIARSPLEIEVLHEDEPGEFQLVLRHTNNDPFRQSPELKLSARPISLNVEALRPIVCGLSELARFRGISLEAITSFMAFRVEATYEDQSLRHDFVRNLPLVGVPEDRNRSILRTLLRDKNDVLRYLLMLLVAGDAGAGDTQLIARVLGSSHGDGTDRISQFPVFEALVHALHQDPHKLDDIARLVDDLLDKSDANDLLPEGFSQIWDPIWRVRRQMEHHE